MSSKQKWTRRNGTIRLPYKPGDVIEFDATRAGLGIMKETVAIVWFNDEAQQVRTLTTSGLSVHPAWNPIVVEKRRRSNR